MNQSTKVNKPIEIGSLTMSAAGLEIKYFICLMQYLLFYCMKFLRELVLRSSARYRNVVEDTHEDMSIFIYG